MIPVHTKRPPPPDLLDLLDSLPPGFVDDGLSSFPDSILGWSIAVAGRGHDALYCTRLWSAGALDQEWRASADNAIGRWVRALLPWGVRNVGFAVAWGVYVGGGVKAFDSCGANPSGASDEQHAAGLCRHGVAKPAWMKGDVP